MRIALAIVRLFNHGGLQRDCIAIARRLVAMGHEVEIVCTEAVDPPADLVVTVLPVRGWTNHGRNAGFSRALKRYAERRFDVIAGFDALEGLDVLYCANPPVRLRGLLDRLTPRKRTLLALERACFGPASKTRVLCLAEPQRQAYTDRWHLAADRITVIPPTIDRARLLPASEQLERRRTTRQALSLDPDSLVWLFVGSFPHTKGLDRALDALATNGDATLLCVGPRADDNTPYRSHRAAVQVRWLGARDDIPALMAAADLLVHPARADVTGTVMLEALGNGLPVVATAVCGYAMHVRKADAGRVLEDPFTAASFAAALREATVAQRARWQANARAYCAATDLTSGLDVAAERIANRL